MNVPEKVEVYVFLHDGTMVRETFYDMIVQQIEDVIEFLEPGVKYTAEMLYGAESWQALNIPDRILAGKCLAHMVRTGKLPLNIQGCEHQYPRKYMT